MRPTLRRRLRATVTALAGRPSPVPHLWYFGASMCPTSWRRYMFLVPLLSLRFDGACGSTVSPCASPICLLSACLLASVSVRFGSVLSVLFCSVLFLFCSVLFLFCSALFCFCSVLFFSALFCSVCLCSALFSVWFCSVPFCSVRFYHRLRS